MTVSVPTGALVAVQLSAGSVAVHSVVPPTLKVTVPVALEGNVAVYVTVCSVRLRRRQMPVSVKALTTNRVAAHRGKRVGR